MKNETEVYRLGVLTFYDVCFLYQISENDLIELCNKSLVPFVSLGGFVYFDFCLIQKFFDTQAGNYKKSNTIIIPNEEKIEVRASRECLVRNEKTINLLINAFLYL